MEVSGSIALGENLGPGAALQRRLYGWKRHVSTAGCAVYILLIMWGGVLSGQGGDTRSLIGFLLMISGVVFMLLLGRWNQGVLISAWKARGVADQDPVTYSLTDEGLRISAPSIDYLVKWDGVLEIADEPAYWLMIVPEMSYFLPKRFFTDPAAHRAFIAECLSHLSPDARARSAAADRFIDIAN